MCCPCSAYDKPKKKDQSSCSSVGASSRGFQGDMHGGFLRGMGPSIPGARSAPGSVGMDDILNVIALPIFLCCVCSL
jgi:hypothetical protein